MLTCPSVEEGEGPVGLIRDEREREGLVVQCDMSLMGVFVCDVVDVDCLSPRGRE